MAQDDNNKIVVFSESTAPIIFEILKKYNLEETSQEAMETMKNGKLFRGGIILNITEKIVLNDGLKKDLASMLMQELNVSAEIANNVAKDIQNQLLPIARISSLQAPVEEKNTIEATLAPKLEIFPNREPMPIPESAVGASMTKVKQETIKKIPKKFPKKEIIQPAQVKENKNIYKGKDTYREPIE